METKKVMDPTTKKMKSQKRRIPFTMNQDAVKIPIGEWAKTRLRKNKGTEKKTRKENQKKETEKKHFDTSQMICLIVADIVCLIWPFG